MMVQKSKNVAEIQEDNQSEATTDMFITKLTQSKLQKWFNSSSLICIYSIFFLYSKHAASCYSFLTRMFEVEVNATSTGSQP